MPVVNGSASVGLRIQALRARKGYTLAELAALAGSSKSYIWELENKNPPRPSAEKLSRIAEALGVTTDYLMGHTGDAGDAEDKAFYQRYLSMEPEAKRKLRAIADILAE